VVIRYLIVQKEPNVQTVLARVVSSSTLGFGFAFAASLWAFIESTTASLGKDTGILDLAVEAFKSELERLTGVNLNFTHGDYQRDRRSLR
jgi:hypothetical protein